MAHPGRARGRARGRGDQAVGQARLSQARAPAARDGDHLDQGHGGMVPADRDALLALPGIGSYTAAAVASFAFGQRHAVLDTNVRRVLARLVAGRPTPAAAPSVAERRLAESLLPAEPAVAARWSVAVMELGALVCTAASPRCSTCPVARDCAWLAAGRPKEPKDAGEPGGAGPAPDPALRRDGPAMPRPPARRGARFRRPGEPGRLRRGLARPGPAGPGPGRPHRGRPGRPAA